MSVTMSPKMLVILTLAGRSSVCKGPHARTQGKFFVSVRYKTNRVETPCFIAERITDRQFAADA